MERFYRRKEYIDFIKKLDKSVYFYTMSYGAPGHDGLVDFGLPDLYISEVRLFMRFIEDFGLSLSERDIPEFEEMKIDLRHKILSRVYKIPGPAVAREIYLTNYPTYLKYCESQSKVYPEILFIRTFKLNEFRNDLEESDMISKNDLFESWMMGATIIELEKTEEALNRLCVYFKTQRKFVNPNSAYKGIDIRSINNKIDVDRLANFLVNHDFIHYYQKINFIELLLGKTFYEPIFWKGNKSQLCKLIYSIYFIPKKKNELEVQWKKICSFIIIDGRIPSESQLKGAFTTAEKSIQKLSPMGKLVEDSLNQPF